MSSEQQTKPDVEYSVLRNSLDLIAIKYDVSSIISLVFPLIVLSIINFLLVLYIAVLVSELKQLPSTNQAVQMEPLG
jgi:hypothetical protein